MTAPGETSRPKANPTDEQRRIARLLRAARSGLTIEQLNARFGMGKNEISRLLKANGFTIRPGKRAWSGHEF